MKAWGITNVFFWVLMSLSCQANNTSFAQQYIKDKIQRLEDSIVECESIASAHGMPDSESLDLLRKYEHEDVRVFLITRSAAMAEECQKPALTDLAYTIGMLKASTAYSEVEDLISSIKPLIYGEETWTIKEKYYQLPEAMRDELEAVAYFQRPFRNIPILEMLEASQ